MLIGLLALAIFDELRHHSWFMFAIVAASAIAARFAYGFHTR